MDQVLGNVFTSVLGIKDTLETSIGDIKTLVHEGEAAHRDEIEFLIFAARRAPLSSAGRLQDLWVLFERGEKRNGYFVEFGGSGDGAGRNTLLLEKFYGWSGAIAEPARSRQETLRAHRDCYITDKFIYKDDGLKILFSDADRSQDAATGVSAGADPAGRVRRAGKRYEVETLSLRGFLQAADAPRVIDYLSIGIEDDTLDVLQHFEFSEYDVKLLSIAAGDPDQGREVREFMTQKGYVSRFKTFSASEDWYVTVDSASASSASV